MAVPPVPTVPNTPVAPVYNDDDNANGHKSLPTGPCNFTNLSAGPNAPKCGCRRFWDQSAGSPMLYEFGDGKAQQGPRAGWCMCEHHACFHDAGGEARQPVTEDYAVVGGGAVTKRESVYQQSTALHRITQPGGEQQRSGAPDVGLPQSQGAFPDTLQWDRFINSGANLGGLPPIPSQCLMQSDNSSVGSVSQSRYSRPFAGLGLQTLSHIPKPNTQGHDSLNRDKGRPANKRERVMRLYEDSAGRGFLQSLTEAATPSLRCSQDVDGGAAFEKNLAGIQASLQKLADVQERDTETTTIACRPNSIASPDPRNPQEDPAPISSGTVRDDNEDKRFLPQIRSIVKHVSNSKIAVQNHERRLDLLENASFCNAGIEELQDKHENLDNRVVELESRVEEVEKAQVALNDVSSVGSRQHLDGSFDSNTSSAIMASAIDRVEFKSRIEALEAQVSSLQASASPSYQQPWEVEVVFLPFGSRLMGIWSSKQSMTQRSRTNSLPSDDWTQTQHNTMAAAQACLTAREQATAWEHAASDVSDHQSWLMPKACGLRSRVDERLRSRGLVKTIQITGPDARDVQAAMMSAFGEMPTILAGRSFSQLRTSPIPQSLNNYLGLQSPWIPLRKVHKDSCLRFLNSSEMVTPALWTVPHLKSSVAMRTSAHVRRLYVTQADSYIQHLGDGLADWTWQKLRELPRVYLDPQSSLEVPEADAQETCWEYDERLDPLPSIHSSFTSHHSSLSIRSIQHEEEPEPTSPSDHFSSAAVSPALSTTPTSVPVTRQLSPLKERNPFRTIHGRTTSMPSLVPIKSSPSQGQGLGLSKRRIASFDHETQSSPIKAAHASSLKRRRISRSPSRPHDTPRWSVGPPSPYAFEDINISDKKRGTTPFAYATPHSNAPYIEVMRPMDDYDDEQGSTTDDLHQDDGYFVGQNYDSDSGSEGVEDEGHQPDEEWEGVQDEAAEYESRHGGKSVLVGRDENAEDDVDDQSDISSQPSEYPSTQQHSGMFALSANGAGFKIHIDEEVYDEGI